MTINNSDVTNQQDINTSKIVDICTPGSIWTLNESLAVVLFVANTTATDLKRYPITIFHLKNGKVHAQTVERFVEDHIFLKNGVQVLYEIESSDWIHEKSGTKYTILTRSSDVDPIVAYHDGVNIWARPESDWARSMTPIKSN